MEKHHDGLIVTHHHTKWSQNVPNKCKSPTKPRFLVGVQCYGCNIKQYQTNSNNTVPKWWMFMDFPLGRYRNQATPGCGSNGPFTRGPAPGPAIGFLAIGCGPGAVRLPWILGSLDWITRMCL